MWELAEKEKPLPQSVASESVNFINRGRSRSKNNRRNSHERTKTHYKNKNACYRCGRSHDLSKCPAVNWECFVCFKKGHTSRVCRKRLSSRSPSPRGYRNNNSRSPSPHHLQTSINEFSQSMQSLSFNSITVHHDINSLNQNKPAILTVFIEG